MAERNRLVKLVRDKIVGEREAEYRPIGKPGGPEHVAALRQKLVEEAVEYLLDPCPEELGDVFEVVGALARWDQNMSFSKLDDTAVEKFRRKGGFDTANGMYVSVKEPGTR